ncbi:RBBP9/YdeN family alpha/beta hydrolase [Chitinophaga sp. 30R24]|uniref:RBBP9/YdeN family alpha/beta hydrolase n=1 Tax=Chitinophaga sp. 30R24 TaxID=3248838 RepID=UPI003B8F2757
MEIKVLTLPGLRGSGPLHWQTKWETSLTGIQRIEQSDWDAPVCANWIKKIEQAVKIAGPQVVIAAHSLGCVALAHWAQQSSTPITGALLVAPADAEQPDFPPETKGFTPIPLTLLPFKSIVVASTNDDYCTLERALFFAERWGSRFVNAGAKGHINSDSAVGDWPEGQTLLKELVQNWATL